MPLSLSQSYDNRRPSLRGPTAIVVRRAAARVSHELRMYDALDTLRYRAQEDDPQRWQGAWDFLKATEDERRRAEHNRCEELFRRYELRRSRSALHACLHAAGRRGTRCSRRARVTARIAGKSASTGDPDPDPEPPTTRRYLGCEVARAAAVAELIRTALAAADQLVGSLVSHLRSSRSESVTPLGELPAPGESPHDPRAAGKRLHFAGEHAHPEIKSATGRPAALTESVRQAVDPRKRNPHGQRRRRPDHAQARRALVPSAGRRAGPPRVVPSGGGR